MCSATSVPIKHSVRHACMIVQCFGRMGLSAVSVGATLPAHLSLGCCGACAQLLAVVHHPLWVITLLYSSVQRSGRCSARGCATHWHAYCWCWASSVLWPRLQPTRGDCAR